jgi:homogentisate 1,2-dioxygenase
VIDRMAVGSIPEKPHTAMRDAEGRLLYEEMHTREGFDGPFTYFYHLYPVTAARRVSISERGWARPRVDDDAREPLKRRLYDGTRVPPGTMLCYDRTPLFFSEEATVWLARPTQTDEVYVANADGDELWFVRHGSARLESNCGWLDVAEGDYVFVPRALVHRWHVLSPEVSLLGLEGRRGFSIPEAYRNRSGQLRLDAPYTHRDFVRPSGPIARPGQPGGGPTQLLVAKGGRYSLHEMERCPMDAVGWDGFVYPFAFPIEKFQPKTGALHLPPTVHTTFAGSHLVVSSFVPRMLDYGKDAIPCPYPHSNVDCDEVILYLRGEFTSRRGVDVGAISLHPSGIAHGPHPGAYEASSGAVRTDELAVMIDSFQPLTPTPQAANLEVADYHASWQTE